MDTTNVVDVVPVAQILCPQARSAWFVQQWTGGVVVA